VEEGTRIDVAYFDQLRHQLDLEKTVIDNVAEGRDFIDIDGQSRHVLSYLGDFLFSPQRARTPVKALSGGERARLLLAKLFSKPANLLVLDEPTNDLDLETLDLLQEAIADYAGTVILVSHDRDFLDRTVTSVLAAEGNGHWVEYAGGYSDMLAQRREAAPENGTNRQAVRKTIPQQPAREPAPARKARRKLSFKEKHALDALPGEIESLTLKLARLRETLANPQLFTSDPAHFRRTAGELESTESALSKAEERWLELALLRDELGE
jgi:ATP-binding cassette subfamily F protein uup